MKRTITPIDMLTHELARNVEVYRGQDGVLRSRDHSHKIDITDTLVDLFENDCGESGGEGYDVTVQDFTVEQGPDGRIYLVAETVEIDDH